MPDTLDHPADQVAPRERVEDALARVTSLASTVT